MNTKQIEVSKDMDPNEAVKAYKKTKAEVRKIAVGLRNLINSGVLVENHTTTVGLNFLGNATKHSSGIKLMVKNSASAKRVKNGAENDVVKRGMDAIIALSKPWADAFEGNRQDNGREGKSFSYLP